MAARGALAAQLPGEGSTRVAGSADDALTALYTAEYRRLVGLAALLVDDVPTAEDVVQDAFVRMHAAWWRLRAPDKAAAYLRQTVVNLARSRLRRRRVAERHAPAADPSLESTARSAEETALAAVDRERVVAALRELPTRQREVLVLRYVAELSEAQIATTLGISAGSVKTHASRGMAALRARLEER